MINAAEARKMAGPTLDEKIDALGETIKKQASKGHRQCKTGWTHQEDLSLWIDGGYDQSKDWKQAKQILEALGFQVSFFYEEKQFVNMYTLIEW